MYPSSTSFGFMLASVLVGAIAGSFVGVVVARLPHGRTIVRGRSRCDDCGATLGPLELVPILSYLALRGRCRRCGAAIGADPIVAEVAGALVALLAVRCATTPGAAVALALFGWTLVALAMLDYRRLWLPDSITIPLLLGGFAAAPLLPVISLSSRISGAVLGYAGLAALRFGYRRFRGRDGLGGGDAKLLAAIGAWLGAPALPTVLLLGAALGLALALVHHLRGRTLERDTALPLGSFLGVAALAWLPVALRQPDATLFGLIYAG